ncbi:zf-HC2 domain-containing protein [Streptomyces malaysiensis]|uniref:zf-HC2 domain-containing protein n=1 Tax=Streptomyces malaysiensis TaxID=92644 RepID=UPI0033C60A84
MSPEHASSRLIHDYARGETGIAVDELWALESHLETCGYCRDRLAKAVAVEAPGIVTLLGSVRSGLESRLDNVEPMPFRRRRWARLPTWVTPVMGPWLVMIVSLPLVALLLDVAAPGFGSVPLVLLLAPVLPLAGVATAWSRSLDPAHELVVSTPRAGLNLLLRRTTAVLALLVPTLLLSGWLTGVTVAQWLLPSLAFTTTALALGSVMDISLAAAALGSVWAVLILAPALVTNRAPLVLQPERLPVWGVLLALGAGVVLVRKDAYSLLKDPHRS